MHLGVVYGDHCIKLMLVDVNARVKFEMQKRYRCHNGDEHWSEEPPGNFCLGPSQTQESPLGLNFKKRFQKAQSVKLVMVN